MIRVKRPTEGPADLIEKGGNELERARSHFEGTPPNPAGFNFATYKLTSVKDALEKMFHGKCAYCEAFYASTQPLDVEHFRPKGAVVDVADHRGYWWIAMDWQNLLPSCIDCNRKRNQVTPEGDTSQVRLRDNAARFTSSATVSSGKKDSFPIAATGTRAMSRAASLESEKPLLLNPCTDYPDQHLSYFFDLKNLVSFVVARPLAGDADYSGPNGLSLKGATSIHVYGLNRLRLVQARTEMLRRLEFLAGLAIDLKLMAQDLEARPDEELKRAGRQVAGFGDSIVEELGRMSRADQPYSAMVKAWLAGFIERLQQSA